MPNLTKTLKKMAESLLLKAMISVAPSSGENKN